MRVLIVKTSSLGDILHTLPALTDARLARPEIVFDWVVEEDYADVPGWHPAVDQVIPVAIRRWRKNIFRNWHTREWKQFRTALRKHHYDLVIDAQGLLKSAWITLFVKAPTAGFDQHSVRESLAAWAYRQHYGVPRQMHAVERTRSLFAQALGYAVPDNRGDFALAAEQFSGAVEDPPTVVFLHGSKDEEKHYPQKYWQSLAALIGQAGYRIRLPWVTQAERARAEAIAADCAKAEVLPPLDLQAMASVLARANAVVAVESELGHLSAALKMPTVSLYGPGRAALIGAYGKQQVHLCSDALELDAEQTEAQASTKLERITPEHIYKTLLEHFLTALPDDAGGSHD